MNKTNVLLKNACIFAVCALSSCSIFQSKDTQMAKQQIEIQDEQKQEAIKDAKLKEMADEMGQLSQDNDILKQSLSSKSDQLSKTISVLMTEKQALEKKIGLLQESLDVQKAQENREIAQTKTAYEQLIGELKKEVADKSIEVQQYKGMLTINMVDQIFFDSGKADIKQQGNSVLNRVGAILKKMPDQIIRIEGHTDDVPIASEYRNYFPNNWSLGSRRAENVALHFIDNDKIDPMRIEVVSFSKYRPRVPNDSEVNRAKNRRIEIILTNRNMSQIAEMKDSIKQP
jgi:chemotaxis protein MotB